MGIKGVQDFDGGFQLLPETEAMLTAYLRHPDMIAEVCKQAQCEGAEYTGELFQPVPYSARTPFGMPAVMHRFHLDPEHSIINVPPVVMFKAKVFKPSRLCAVYRVNGLSAAARADIQRRRAQFENDAAGAA
ncbi:unnamed protein product, partial [Phaeothamnion confervicola]